MVITENTSMQDKMIDQIRKSNSMVKSFNDIVQLLDVIASEQKARNMLRSCIDKVHMNMSAVHNLRDILERLQSVARINELRFRCNVPYEQASIGQATQCQILGDLFDVVVVLVSRDNHYTAPAILDVKVTYLEQAKSCPELVEIIRNGRFLDLSKHLKSLIEMFPASMDRQTKKRVFMAKQSLEADINKMSQLYKDSHKDADNINIVMHGLVGLIAPPVMGQGCNLHYFITPHDLLNLKTQSFEKNLDQLDRDTGLHAEIGINSYATSCILPISPLISNNHPISGSEQPRFLDVNQHNSVSLPACFVLKLQPSVVLMQHIAVEIEQETGMPLLSKTTELKSYLTLIKESNEVQEVVFDDLKQQYNLNLDRFKAATVSEILFTRPGHLLSILVLLRKQAYLNTLFRSCVRPKKNTGEDITVRHFDVVMEGSKSNLSVTFQHPLSPTTTALAEISFSGDGFLSCHLFTGRSDPALCSDQYALTILQKSFSLPITMRVIMIQTKRNPRKEPDKHRSSRQSSILQHPATAPMSKKPPPPPAPPLPPVNQPVKLQNVVTSNSTMSVQSTPFPKSMFQPLKSSNVTPMPKDAVTVDTSKKETQHPMLTQLLKPQSQAKMQNVTAQPKTNPLLMDLLKDGDVDSKAANSQQLLQHQHMQQQVNAMQQRTAYSHQQQQLQQQQQQQQQQLQQQQQPQQVDFSAHHQIPPPPQYGVGSQMPPQFVQQHPQDQMPPPPSYQAPAQIKGPMQQQFQSLPQYSNQSPLQFDDHQGPPGRLLTSPFNSQTSGSHSTTPPLYGISSPLQSPSQPSPMNFTPSPRQPPINTPQSLPIASPRHMTATPPIMSPSNRKLPLIRRTSRAKGKSSDQSGFELKSENILDMGFTAPSGFDTVAENENGQLMEFHEIFGMTPPPPSQQSSLQYQVASPVVTPGALGTNQRHFSGDRAFNFSFDSDIGLDGDLQRRNSYNRRPSNQPFMTPSPALSTNQDNQEPGFPIPSPANSMDGFQPSAFTLTDTKPVQLDLQHTNFIKSEVTDVEVPSTESKSVVCKVESMTDQIDVDPFNFDDNKTPQKISMPDSSGGSDLKRTTAMSSRSSSISSNSGTEEGSRILPAGHNITKAVKVEKIVNAQKASGSRRGSQEYTNVGVRSVDSNTVNPPAHKALVRQNAIGKGSTGMMRFQSIQSEAKEKPKKQRSTKDDKGPPKRRGRPPSTDKKEHPIKRKKVEGEDSEQRRKIVLNVQLNKGTPISSTTKTKPVPAEPPSSDKTTPSSATASAAPSNPSIEAHKSESFQNMSPVLKQYFRNQGEQQEKKKKEKKIATGSSSPLIALAKSGVKAGNQSITNQASNIAAVRSQSATAKSTSAPGSNGNKVSVAAHVKTGSVPSQTKSVPRPRKEPFSEVAITKQTGQAQQAAPSNGKRPHTNPAAPKLSERPTPIDTIPANTVKLKGVPPTTPKFSTDQFPKLLVSKTSDERAVAVKPSAPQKQGVHNKSPGSHSLKQAISAGRSPAQGKRDKPGATAPLRDVKAVSLPSSKTEKTLSKGKDGASGSGNQTGKPYGGQGAEGGKRVVVGRPPLSSKSPRSVTPPQARLPVGGTTQSKSDRSQTIAGRKSPAHAADPALARDSTDDKSFRSSSILGKHPPTQEPAFLPPPAKKLTDSSVRGNPSSPDDRLIIVDGNDDLGAVGGKQSARARIPTPTFPQPPPLTQGSNPTMNPYVAMSSLSVDISPAVPFEVDDDLMDEAVLLHDDPLRF